MHPSPSSLTAHARVCCLALGPSSPTQVLVGVYFFIAVMGCLLGIKRFEYALLLLPLAGGVLVFHVLVRW